MLSVEAGGEGGADAVSGLSVVVPALNEGPTLKDTVADLRKALVGRNYEVLVIDDGSEDGSSDGLAASDVRVIKNPMPMGYGHAVKQGVRAARFEHVGIIDADRTYRAEDLVALWNLVPGFDMVVGARTLPGSQMPWLRRAVKAVLFRFAEYVAGTRIPDLNSGLRVFTREAALRHESLLPHGFSLTTTLTLALLADGRPVTYVPIVYLAREGKSKIQPMRDTLRFASHIVKMACQVKPLKVFVPIGLALLTAAAIRLAWDVLVAHDIGDSSTMLVTSGLEVALMGLLAELVVRRRS